MHGYERHLAPKSAGSDDDWLWVLRKRESQNEVLVLVSKCMVSFYHLLEADSMKMMTFGRKITSFSLDMLNLRRLWNPVDRISNRKLEKQFWNLEMKSGKLT